MSLDRCPFRKKKDTRGEEEQKNNMDASLEEKHCRLSTVIHASTVYSRQITGTMNWKLNQRVVWLVPLADN